MNNELKHYGVPGMRWGHRKVSYDQSRGIASKQKHRTLEQRYEDKQKERQKKINKFIGVEDESPQKIQEQASRSNAVRKEKGKALVKKIINKLLNK